MRLNVGIVGMGFMGRCHYGEYHAIKGAKLTAICDVDPKKRTGDLSGAIGNIGMAGKKESLSGIKVYASAGKMLADPDIDVIDITLPTHLHAKYAIAAFKAGKHVICEKPMARTSADANKMIVAAKKAGRRLFIAQCIRFWPAYVEARRIVQSRKYGAVVSAVFNRMGGLPLWSWQNWLQVPEKSGLCALDLHIHDADYVLYLFGAPKAVTSLGGGLKKGRLDHIVTTYHYADNKFVKAEGAWEYAPGYPFSMTFSIAMEKATLMFGTDGKLMLMPRKGKMSQVKTEPVSAYGAELSHFLDCIRRNAQSKVVTPQDAAQSVRLVEAEVRSALSGKTVKFRG